MDAAIDQSENILGDDSLPVYAHGHPTFPCRCDLCWRVIEDRDDLIWHGYGNCVEIPDWEEM